MKYEKALQWGIPVVDMAWLEDVATTGVIASSSRHNSPPRASSPKAPASSRERHASAERAVDEQAMADITNSKCSNTYHSTRRANPGQMTHPLQIFRYGDTHRRPEVHK